MKVLLDTNAYSALRRGHEFVAEQVRNSEEVLLSIVVVGELLFGFRNGSRYEENTQALRDDRRNRPCPGSGFRGRALHDHELSRGSRWRTR